MTEICPGTNITVTPTWHGQTPTGFEISSVRFNGKPLTHAYLTYKELMDGGVLEFDMASKPNKKLFQAVTDKPYSLSRSED